MLERKQICNYNYDVDIIMSTYNYRILVVLAGSPIFQDLSTDRIMMRQELYIYFDITHLNYSANI